MMDRTSICEALAKRNEIDQILNRMVTGGSFAMREKGGDHLVPGPDCMVDTLKLLKQALKISGETLQTCVVWRCPDGT
ncbi:hypothetical protein TNCV_1320551 [Trichonephila clavipes]|nr:hypothetical protein TNCV_1320551 [Trichonephila clavipes]